MNIYHFTESIKSVRGIIERRCIDLGRHTDGSRAACAMLRPPECSEIFMISECKEAWIFQLEVADDHPFEQDPSSDNKRQDWILSRIPIPIIEFGPVRHIPVGNAIFGIPQREEMLVVYGGNLV